MNQEKIGKFISEIRKERKLTQQELAEKLGVSDRTIGNWENGRNMPDLSLFKSICDELHISINELLSGERLNKEEYQEKFEENIVNTIDYTNKKMNIKDNIIGIVLLIFGFLLTLTAISIFPSESSWSSIYSVLGTIVALLGFSKFTKKLTLFKRLSFNVSFFIIFIAILFVLDYVNVRLNDQAPRFSMATTSVNTTILYDTLFYDVYRCNVNQKEEYFKIEKNKKYTIESIMEYCK